MNEKEREKLYDMGWIRGFVWGAVAGGTGVCLFPGILKTLVLWWG